MLGFIILIAATVVVGVSIWMVVSKKNTSNSFQEIGPFFDGFFKYVFNDLSKCPSKECSIKSPDICPLSGCCTDPDTVFAQSYGNILCRNDSSKADCNTINNKLPFAKIDYILRNFEHFGLIQYKIGTYALSGTKEGNYYMLGGYKRLSWKNINDINVYDATLFQQKNPDVYNYLMNLFKKKNVAAGPENVAIYIRYIFWYFRKYVVDTLVSSSLLKHNVTGLSVGSTNITSDYDVTIYGDSYVNISAAIIEFNSTFLKIFNEQSSNVFDTNLYGVSAINMVNENKPSSAVLSHDSDKFASLFSNDLKTCGLKQFQYTKTDPNSVISQHVWALVTVLMHLKDIEEFDDKVYAYLMGKFVSMCEGTNSDNNFCSFLSIAENFINTYPVDIGRYPQIVKSLENTKVDINDFNNFISFVNYNGMETYVCRGTFLDVVVNQQMCGSKAGSAVVQLTNDDYFDSFIENTACLLSHYHKAKYLQRVVSAFTSLKNLSSDTMSKVNACLQTIKSTQDSCNGDATELLSCAPFIIMDNCIDMILAVSIDVLNLQTKKIEHVYFIS